MVHSLKMNSAWNSAESQIPFGNFLNVQMLGEPLGKKLCEGLVIFEKPFRIFIDQ